MNRKNIYLALAFLMLVPLMAWSTGGGETKSSSPSAGGGQPVTIRFAWWGGDARHQATLKNIARYQELNPGVKIEPEYGAYGGFLEKLYVQLASKTVPDIPCIDGKWVQDMMRNYRDSFRNLREMDIDLSGFDPEFLNIICGDEKFTLGASMGTNNYGLIYSPNFFKKFGLGDPTNWNWDDYLAAGKKVQQQDKESHLMYNILNTYTYIFKWRIKQITGKDIVSEANTLQFTEADAEKSWQYVLDLVQTGTVPPFEESMPYAKNYANEVPKWLQGKYGMTLCQVSTLSAIATGTPFELKAANIPIIPGAKNVGFPIDSSQVIGVYAYGKHQEEVAKFVNWFVNDSEAIRTTGDTRGLPSNQRAAKILRDTGVLMPLMVEIAENYTQKGSTKESIATSNPAILELSAEFVQQVAYKRMSPKQAAVEFMQELEKICAAAR